MIDLADIKISLNDFLSESFDYRTLEDNSQPFFIVTHLKTINHFTYLESYGQFLHEPHIQTPNPGTPHSILAAAHLLTGSYLNQDRNSLLKPYITEFGCCDSLKIDKNNIILITVISPAEEAKWICKTVIKQLEISLNLTAPQ
jgi:hypothetical protein